MATDIEIIVKNIRSVFDFKDKSVIQVGAGGGQLIGCAKDANSIIAVDNDPSAIEKLNIVVGKNKQFNNISIIEGTIDSINQNVDIVFFEFCLHEIDNPGFALNKAFEFAPQILVVDHHPDSEWAWITCETEKVTQSWIEVEKYYIIQKETYNAIQLFSDYLELYRRIEPLGKLAIERIQRFQSQKNISIKMQYTITHIKK